MRAISSKILVLVASACFFSHEMRADSLDSIRIAADAKWVVHLDWEKFRGSQIGAYLEETWLSAQRERIWTGFERDVDFNFYWGGVQSVTAFGWEYDGRPEKAGVLLIRTSLEIQKELRQLLESKIIADFTSLKIQWIESEFEHFYSIAGELYVAVEPGDCFCLENRGGSWKQRGSPLMPAGWRLLGLRLLRIIQSCPNRQFFWRQMSLPMAGSFLSKRGCFRGPKARGWPFARRMRRF